MDQEQFNLLNRVVQWAVKDSDAADHDRDDKREEVHWYQGDWFRGAADGEVPGFNDYYGRPQFHYVDVTCGSHACIAGNVVNLMGDKFIVNTGGFYNEGDMVSVVSCIDKEGEVHSIMTRAQELLGITPDESSELFAGHLGIEDVVEAATEIAQGYGFTLNPYQQEVNA